MIISVCLFVCPITTQEPLNRFASNFNQGICWLSSDFIKFMFLGELRILGKAEFPGKCFIYMY